jgi:hypothetical protein
MRRREFIAGMGGAVAWPVEQPGPIKTATAALRHLQEQAEAIVMFAKGRGPRKSVRKPIVSSHIHQPTSIPTLDSWIVVNGGTFVKTLDRINNK